MTLLEVLIAGLLLFMAISLAAMTYQASIKTESSARKSIVRSVALGFIREQIAEDLRVNPEAKSGQGGWGDIQYDWEITRSQSKSAKAGFDIESNTQAQLGKVLVLSDIRIVINDQEHEYVHLSWQ